MKSILRWLQLPKWPDIGWLGLDPDAGLERARRRMLEADLLGRGISAPRVLKAFARVPREAFVTPERRASAYDDKPLQIGHGQTISQPYIVARMTELLEVRPGEKVLEIGAGCGYQAAILRELGAEVYAVEIIPDLASKIEQRLSLLGYERVHVSCHDGHLGWKEHAPFDAILLSAAPPEIPPALFEQTRVGGRIVAPVGNARSQVLIHWTHRPEGWASRKITPVRFVPMTGSA